MDKEKIIYYAGSCVTVLAIGISLVFLFKTHSQEYLYLVLLVFVVTGLPLEIWYTRVKEKQNPLSQKRILNALVYAAHKKFGLKSEFIQENNEKMYEHFINRGFIHECLITSGNEREENPRWEVTLLGIKTKKFYE